MIFLNTTYVSPLLQQALLDNEVAVFDLQQQSIIRPSEKRTVGILNAENAFSAYKAHNPHTQATQLAELFKNKIAFRKHLATHHAGFFFKELTFEELHTIDASALSYPLIIKPAEGYSSVGVYRIDDATNFEQTLNKLEETMLAATDVDTLHNQLYLLESYISGQEFAVDMFYNDALEPVILNIFTRMFKDAHDMSDRIYYTSKEVMSQNLAPITSYLKEVKDVFDIQEPMPLHIELRIDESGHIMPIEVNPLRFAGEGTTELGYFAYNVNPYDYFFQNKKPDWPALLEQMDEQVYCFTCAAFETMPTEDEQYDINHEQLKKHFSNILEYRHLPKEAGSTFAVIFYGCDSLDALQPILSLDFDAFKMKQQLQHKG